MVLLWGNLFPQTAIVITSALSPHPIIYWTVHCMPRSNKRGTKVGCKLLTQIRVGKSYLNSHGFTVGKSLSPHLRCNNSSIESPSHYFLDCTLHAEEQRTLFDTFEHYIPKFKSFSKKTKLETILYGYDIDNNEIFTTNVSLQLATQKYILQTKRFN